MKKKNINEQVIITALGFRKNLTAYPRRMVFRGLTYHFIDAGLRCLIFHSDRIAEIITLTDGEVNYCLRSDDRGCNWILLSIAS